jgi:hypothetical protein
MAFKIQQVDYFYTSVKDEPGQAYKMLARLSQMGINLMAFKTVPMGPASTQVTLFPADSKNLLSVAKKSGMSVTGPHPAILVRGDDELGALANVHMKLYSANVNVYASSGVSDGSGSFGYIIYLRSEDIQTAMKALNI